MCGCWLLLRGLTDCLPVAGHPMGQDRVHGLGQTRRQACRRGPRRFDILPFFHLAINLRTHDHPGHSLHYMIEDLAEELSARCNLSAGELLDQANELRLRRTAERRERDKSGERQASEAALLSLDPADAKAVDARAFSFDRTTEDGSLLEHRGAVRLERVTQGVGGKTERKRVQAMDSFAVAKAVPLLAPVHQPPQQQAPDPLLQAGLQQRRKHRKTVNIVDVKAPLCVIS